MCPNVLSVKQQTTPNESWRWPLGGWQTEAVCLAAMALVTTWVFAVSSLDIAAARWFYSPNEADHWPLARQFPWPIFYRAATWITASLMVAGLAALGASFTPARRGWRPYAVLVLLSVVLGAGLLANALFKDHWHHPRPRDIVEFDGPLHYVSLPVIGSEIGASFPCGHCTVGFLYAAGWWIWRRQRPGWAALSLAVGLVVGALLGAGRMAAGAHFLSDIVWSALLAFGVVHLLYYHVLRIPAEEVGSQSHAVPLQSRWRQTTTIAALFGGIGVLLALFATPHGTALRTRVPLPPTASAPWTLEVEADTANVGIVLLDAPGSEIAIEGELHGFGFPTSRLGAHVAVSSAPPPVVRYRIESRGWLTDVDGQATLRVPAGSFAHVVVRVGQGNIQITDLTQEQLVRSGAVRLDLHSDRGSIRTVELR